MTNVLILGAYGQIARLAARLFLEQTGVQLTLCLRNAKRLRGIGDQERVRVNEGDVLDAKALDAAMAGQDCVYANLSGRMEEQARNIIRAMHTTGVKLSASSSSARWGFMARCPANAIGRSSIRTGIPQE
jgi:saccharopine dehydrogenase-like NADP-dependent oxidoreductase